MEQINLNLIPGRALPVCHVSQYDVGRTIRFNLFNGDQVFAFASGDTAEVQIRKPDNTVVEVALTVATSDTYVDVTTTEQMTACAGSALCQIQIKNSSQTLGTLNFIMEVEADPMSDGVASDSVIIDLANQVKSASEAVVGNLCDYVGVKYLYSFTSGQYIQTSGAIGSTVNLTPQTSGAINYLIADCNQRDIVYITGKGFGGARLWAFIDSNNVLLDHAAANAVESGKRIVAPIGTSKIILNVDRSQAYDFVRIDTNSPVYDTMLHSANTTINADNYATLGITDLDDIKGNTVYGIATSLTADMVANLPIYGQGGMLLTFAAHAPAGNVGIITAQIYFTTNGLHKYFRVRSNAEYSEWYTDNPATNMTLSSSNYSGVLTDLDNAKPEKIYAFNATITEDHIANMPIYGKTAIMFSDAAYQGTPGTPSGAANVQFFVTIDTLGFYFRTKGSTWSSWKSLINNDNYNLDSYFINTCVQKPIVLDSTKRVILFGDSITTGTGSDDPSNPQYWLKYVSDMTGCQWTTYGVGSSAFVDTGDPDQRGGQIITQINGSSVDWDCDLVVVAGGTNDAGFGYELDESTLLTTLRSEVITCINSIKSNLHDAGRDDAKIIFITPIRRGGATAKKIKIRALLPKVCSVISNAALMNGTSVINGFDFPITVETTEYYNAMTNYDELHPNNIGKMVYARSFLNAVL